MNENVHKMKNEKLPSQWPPDFFKKLHEDHILAQKDHRADLFLPFFFFFRLFVTQRVGRNV